MITYQMTSSREDLQQILALQKKNLPDAIAADEKRDQGFVTVRHDLTLLEAMHERYPHVIAKSQNQVIGYALVMLKSFRERIPILIPMFEEIDRLSYAGKGLAEAAYVVMGQICIDKAFRGQGVFAGLYEYMKKQCQEKFDFVITEVAISNTRSLRAHSKVGFTLLKEYTASDGETWHIIVWDWSPRQDYDHDRRVADPVAL